MSSMLEQAIVDAQALREAALKNAEQAIIEKFAPDIKSAVESLLENSVPAKRQVMYEGEVYSVLEVEDGKMTIQKEGGKAHIVSESDVSDITEDSLLQEEEGMSMGTQSPGAAIEAPFAGSPVLDPEQKVQFSVEVEEPVYEFDLESLKNDVEADKAEDDEKETPSDLLSDLEPDEEPIQTEEDPLADLNLQENADSINEEDELVNEILNLINEMNEEDVLEEELQVEMGIGSNSKDGTFQTNEGTLQYYEEMRKAKEAADEAEEENKELKQENEELQEQIKKFKHKNKQYKDAVEKLSNKLNETFLSNAKLLYSNRTLSDASLNERQKSKIVEAIAKAKSPEEAKSLCETLKATVNSSNEIKSPRTLSESVQRKSNLSGILPRRNRQEDSQQHTFAEHMKKLAGIK